jgi:ectoine hydroxylase-related dioxygenase (phytanoyl-CoA dioxygenase family)
MEIGDWRATRELNPIFRQIRELGLESNIAELDAFGFTIVEPEKLGAQDLAERLKAAVLDLEARQDPMVVKALARPDRPADGRQMYHVLDKDPVFCESMMHPAVLALARYLVGASCRLSNTTVLIKHGPASPTALHCDSVGVPPPLPSSPAVCNVSWILTDYTEEAGTFFMVPGSHKYCRHPVPHDSPKFLGGLEEDDIGVPVTARPGSLVVFGGNTWHATYPKRDDGTRIHVIYAFCRNYVNPAEDFSDVPDEVVERHGPDLAQLIGRNAWQGYGIEGPDIDRYRAAQRLRITPAA